MQRRKFLQNTAKLGVGSLVINGIPVSGYANSKILQNFTCAEVRDRIYVMVNLFGANDTLNTVVPVAQYGTYASTLRPTIKINEVGAASNAAINLDTTLPSARHTALHPVMTAFKSLYDSGKLNVVHGVGYANNNRSHFKSDDLWNTAGDSTPANFDFDSGWAGQLFEYRYPGLLGNPSGAMPDPPCIELGATNGSILFQTSSNNNASVLLTNNNVNTFYNTLVAVGGIAPTSFPTTDNGLEMQYINDIQNLSNSYAQRIQTVFNSGNNSTVTYPNTNIANQLRTVARLIKGGSRTTMYTVHHFGYDTHGAQVMAGSNHMGTHANLLKDLTEAIKAFQDDITALGFEDRVITSTHSEFGRTADENAGSGTDHGGVSTMFIIGKGVTPGITGNPINLSLIDNRALTDLQFDYRSVFASILQDFLGHGTAAMNAARMAAYTATKAPIISPSYVADPGCYINQIVLPVTLTTFRAYLQANGTAEVIWQTVSENNCKEYIVEHSIDGSSFNYLGTVKGGGTSSVELNYNYNHLSPAVGKNFYRLWQIDENGSRRQYGPVILQVKDKTAFVVTNFPNPASSKFTVNINADKKQRATVQFLDIQGHLLAQRNIMINAGANVFNYTKADCANHTGQTIIYIQTELGLKKTLRQMLL
jgi:uncharacterized protein (DUF1501 family)